MLEIGSVVDGKYKILNKVGQGGMSVVYLAMNEKANKQWAIKEVRKDGVKDFEVVKQSLVAETDMLKRLSHPNLPSIIDVIEDEERFLIVMDYIQGNSLEKALEEYGAQPQEKVIQWARQMCDVLGYLHTRVPPIIYRDVKPANIMLKPDGQITLIDFGTAREFKEKNLADTTCLGTIGYAAPEQFGGMGQTDARTDIYCLGATLYHLVTGKNPCEPPYEIRPIREINPALSGGLEKIILKCTKSDPNERYQSAAELMYALEHYDEIDDQYRKKQKRKLAAFILCAVMTLASAGTSVWGYEAAEQKKGENYDVILRNAVDYQDYYDAILVDPARTEAYLALNELLISDFVLTKEEAQLLSQLQVGLDQINSSGYSRQVNVLEDLKRDNSDGYQDICYQIGSSFLFYYDVGVEKDRYSNAAAWFQNTTEKYPVAQIYCDIAECLELISQYSGAQIKQTDKMYDEYTRLWEKLVELKQNADAFDDIDSKLQVWNEIDQVVDSMLLPLLDVTDKEEVIALLNEISESAGAVNKSVIAEDIQQLQDKIQKTIERINTVR